MTENQEFKTWLKENAEHLASYTIEEIAHLAIACGFSRGTVAGWQASESFSGTRVTSLTYREAN